MAMGITVPRYSIAELDEFPEDGNRYEILDGMLMVTPSPGSPHQGVATLIAAELVIALQKPDHAHVYAPGVVQLFPLTQLEPAVLVVPSRFALDAPWVEMTEHWLAVEVLSPSSRRYDRDFKRDAYLALGVQSVWLVDIADRSIEVCEKKGTGRTMRESFDWYVSAADINVRIHPSELFAGLR
jgi:Uma2 family endonuclease